MGYCDVESVWRVLVRLAYHFYYLYLNWSLIWIRSGDCRGTKRFHLNVHHLLVKFEKDLISSLAILFGNSILV